MARGHKTLRYHISFGLLHIFFFFLLLFSLHFPLPTGFINTVHLEKSQFGGEIRPGNQEMDAHLSLSFARIY